MKTLYDANDKPILSEIDKMLKANFAMAHKAQSKYYREMLSKAALTHPATLYDHKGQTLAVYIPTAYSKADFRVPLKFNKADTE